MRGALIPFVVCDYLQRIIPADAGSTNSASKTFGLSKDHPRRCGEHTTTRESNLSNTGSSPQMRGAHALSSGDVDRGRIIPADAGSTP